MPLPLASKRLATAAQHGRAGMLSRFGAYASVLLGLLVTLMIWAAALHNITAEHEHTEQSALQNSRNLARTFEEQMFRSIRAADQTLLYVRNSYERDPKNFDISLWSKNSEFLSDFAFQITITDRRGIVVANNLADLAAQLNLSDREHVRVHMERQTDQLFISKPVLGRISGRWSIQLTRRISQADGSFGGVVIVSLDTGYLSSFYETVAVGERGTVTVVSTDGVVLSRGSRTPAPIGTSVAGGPLMQHFARASSGSYTARSVIDDVERLVTFRQVRGYPVIVTVGMATEEVFETAQENSRRYLIAAGVLSLLLMTLTLLALHHQRTLTAARDAAENATQARSEFLAVMSHEIRTPMNAVLGLAQTLRDTRLDQDQRQQVDSIYQAGDNLLRILNDVLDFSRLDSGRIQLEAIPFSPTAVIENTVGVISHHAHAKGLGLVVEIDPALPPALLGDAGRIRQILLNFLSNAVKFTTRGTITVRVSCGEHNEDAATVTYSVADTGIGIAPEKRDSIFQDFVQGDSSIHRRFGGSGLGLAICKRISDQMGGTVAVASTMGAGATFSFTVRLARADSAGGGREAVDEGLAGELRTCIAAIGRPLRVLLAEDNPSNQFVIIKMLKRFDVALKLAADGTEAIQFASDHPFDLVLMDMQMPDVNGIEATVAIRARGGALASLPIVALTANAYPEDVKACSEAGMTGFIAKPVRQPALVEALLRAAELIRAGLPGGGQVSDVSAGGAPRLDLPAATPDRVGVADEMPALDLAAAEELARHIGDDGLLATLAVFMRETEQRLTLLGSLRAAAEERATIKGEAHTLKGAAATCGFAELSAHARTLERSAAAIGPEEYAQQVAHMQDAFARGKTEAQSLLQRAA